MLRYGPFSVFSHTQKIFRWVQSHLQFPTTLLSSLCQRVRDIRYPVSAIASIEKLFHQIHTLVPYSAFTMSFSASDLCSHFFNLIEQGAYRCNSCQISLS